MPDPGIASIFHKDTLATLSGGRTFDKAQRVLQEGRVLGVEAAAGELAGLVKPQEVGRAPYEVRIWVKEEGLAYACTCPVGIARQFCKHAVAIALTHLAKQRERAEAQIAALKPKLMNLSMNALLDGLIAHAKVDESVLLALQALVAEEA